MKFASKAKFLSIAATVVSLLVGGIVAAPAAHATAPAVTNLTVTTLGSDCIGVPFNAGTPSYTCTVASSTSAILVTPTFTGSMFLYLGDSTSVTNLGMVLSGNSTTVNNAAQRGPITISDGSTVLYTITIHMPPPALATFVSANLYSPAQSASIRAYTYTSTSNHAVIGVQGSLAGWEALVSHTQLTPQAVASSSSRVTPSCGNCFTFNNLQNNDIVYLCYVSGGVCDTQSIYTFTMSISSSSQQQNQQQQSVVPAKPAPAVKFDSIPTFTPGKNGTVDLKGSNLDTYASVTVGGKAGSVSASSDTGVSFKAADGLAPGAYDIVLKTAGGGSLTIQGGYVVAAPVVAPPVVAPAPSIPEIRGVTTSAAPLTGFAAGKASALNATQKAALADVVNSNSATSLTCVGVTSSKISAAVARARATAACDYASRLNPKLTTNTLIEAINAAKAADVVAPVVLNYNRD